MELRVSFPGGKKVDVAFGGHVVKTDQPIGAGGEDSAPAPFDVFLASIGACAGIYAVAFCQNRGIDPNAVEIVERVDFDETTHLATTIDLDVKVGAAFPEKYLSALVRSIDQCKVKKTLASPPQIAVNVLRSAPMSLGGAA